MNYFEGSWLLGTELAGGGWIKQIFNILINKKYNEYSCSNKVISLISPYIFMMDGCVIESLLAPFNKKLC